MSEHRLISACQKGKLWAQKEVYEAYAPTMMALCKRYSGNDEDAKDLLQEGFMTVFTEIEHYSWRGAFGGWVYRIFVNCCLDFLRARHRLREREVLTDVEVGSNTPAPNVEAVSAEELMHCISELPDRYRTVFNLFAVDGYSHTEISEMLGIAEGTSRSYFFRARQLLQEKITALIGGNHAE